MAIRLLLALFFVAVLSCETESRDNSFSRCERERRTPVLFVHGSGLSSESWSDAMAQFQLSGYPASYLYAVDLLPDDGDNILAAETYIREAVHELGDSARKNIIADGCDLAENVKVDIVAHSMGAVSSRWFATQIEPELVRSLVTVAGSNHGTDALCGLEGIGNRQMCPSFSEKSGPDAVQYVLNGTPAAPVDETPFGRGPDRDPAVRLAADGARNIVYLTIRLDPDEWIVPASSAVLDGAGGYILKGSSSYPIMETSPGNLLFLDPAAHDEMPSHPEIIRLLIDLLAQIPAAAPDL